MTGRDSAPIEAETGATTSRTRGIWLFRRVGVAHRWVYHRVRRRLPRSVAGVLARRFGEPGRGGSGWRGLRLPGLVVRHFVGMVARRTVRAWAGHGARLPLRGGCYGPAVRGATTIGTRVS